MRKLLLLASLLFLLGSKSLAQARWTFSLLGGEVINVPVPLNIRQQGYPDIRLTADYRTEAFTLPVYWDWRLSRWQDARSWELEVIHHKLYLNNTTADVQKFNISHGFNLITFNRGFELKKFQYRIGAGFVLSHPESNIRGKEFGNSTNDWDMGYFVTGPVMSMAIGKPYRLSNRFFVAVEAKTTMAYSSVKVAQGTADVYNLAFHLNIGLGVNLTKPDMIK